MGNKNERDGVSTFWRNRGTRFNETNRKMNNIELNMVEEHLNSNNSPFRFNAKELDEETGNYYYGARYYDPKWSIWLSVDPLAEMYPSISSYAYVANNPLRYIDPDGREIVEGQEHVDKFKEHTKALIDKKIQQLMNCEKKVKEVGKSKD